MMGRLLMLALAVCWCSAAPTTDLVVPENLDLTGFSKLAPTAFLQADSADFNHRAKALETIALVNAQGGGTKDCEAAATELKASVNAAVATNNKDLGDLSTGSECPERGQADVKACGIKLQAAEEDASAAGDAVQAALDAPQTLGLEALMKCMSTDVCPQIDAAKATLASEKETQVQKDAAVVAIKEECDDFKASAAQQMFECQCAAKTTYDKVWKTATNGATERDTSWRTSEQLMCVLNKDATCETSPTPTVEAIKLAAGVADAVCPEFTPAEMEEAEQFLKDQGINLPGTLSDALKCPKGRYLKDTDNEVVGVTCWPCVKYESIETVKIPSLNNREVGVGCQKCAKGTIATITEKNSDGTWNIPWGFYTKAYFANYKNTNPGNYQCSPCPLGTFSQGDQGGTGWNPSHSSQSICYPCPPGMKGKAAGQWGFEAACGLCPAGSVSDVYAELRTPAENTWWPPVADTGKYAGEVDDPRGYIDGRGSFSVAPDKEGVSFKVGKQCSDCDGFGYGWNNSPTTGIGFQNIPEDGCKVCPAGTYADSIPAKDDFKWSRAIRWDKKKKRMSAADISAGKWDIFWSSYKRYYMFGKAYLKNPSECKKCEPGYCSVAGSVSCIQDSSQPGAVCTPDVAAE